MFAVASSSESVWVSASSGDFLHAFLYSYRVVVYLVSIMSRGRERIFLMLTSFISLLILARLTVPVFKFCFI